MPPPNQSILGLQKAQSIGPNPDVAPDPSRITQAIGPMPPLEGLLGGLRNLLGRVAGGARMAQGATKVAPTAQELQEMFPKAQGILGDPIEQGKQALYKQFWKIK